MDGEWLTDDRFYKELRKIRDYVEGKKEVQGVVSAKDIAISMYDEFCIILYDNLKKAREKIEVLEKSVN